jgi:uncharacterized protein YcbK (DUF882 family)
VIRIANTVPRSNCGQKFGAEKCRLNNFSPIGDSGRVSEENSRAIKRVLNYPLDQSKSDEINLPELLVKLLVNLSDTFEGAQLCVVSGFRCFDAGGQRCSTFQKQSSRHLTGEAADIVLLGIDPVDVASYALFLNGTHADFKDRLGVGYYPNQEHVHVDVREQGKYWVDTSRGGDAPEYDSSHPAPAEAHRLHYDPRIAPPSPGGQCPVLEEQKFIREAEGEHIGTTQTQQWRNVMYTEPPLRGSPASRRMFQHKQISFAPIPELIDLKAFR